MAPNTPKATKKANFESHEGAEISRTAALQQEKTKPAVISHNVNSLWTEAVKIE